MRRKILQRRVALLAVIFIGIAVATPLAEAAKKSYVSTTIRGTLSHPNTGRPLVGAVVTFTPEDSKLIVVRATTDENGAFEAAGLDFGRYNVEILTAEGETIRGINALPVSEKTVGVTLKISERVQSDTDVDNQPEQIAIIVDKQKTKWKRFWKQFGIYVGAVAVTGALVL